MKSYFDQAVELARLLNIKLTSRKWNGERVAMCGFPIAHLDRYLKILVQKEHRFVAMCEEFVRYDSNGLKEFERRISRIVTPGTLIDESFIDPCNNNYLLAVHVPWPTPPSDSIGLAWIDVSTGEFFSKECAFESLKDELARLAPREIVLDESMKQHKEHPIFAALSEANCLVSYCASEAPSSGDTPMTSRLLRSRQIQPNMSPDESPAELDTRNQTLESRLAAELFHETGTMPVQETSAIELLTRFLQANLLEHMPLLNAPRHEDIQDRMQIDAHTIQGLEIREVGHEGSTKGSLLSVVKRTLTSGGTRLLSRWLCRSLSVSTYTYLFPTFRFA
jgi:DNA mismatch repair ATPase MutS